MLEAHPFADIFPMLDAADGAGLRDDIAAHGLRDKVTLYAGKILDGRNRFRALMEIAKLGLSYKGRELTEVDLQEDIRPAELLGSGDFFRSLRGTEAEALEFVLSKNLHRRHLNESQRAMVAANLATLKPGRPAGDNESNLAHFRLADAAERLHVSETSIKDARVVRDRGIGDINDAVQRGELAVSVAAQLARLPAVEQARLIREHADPKALSRVAKEMRAESQTEKAARRQQRERELGAKQQALPDRKYGVIISDAEWKYKVRNRITGGDRLPDNHYPTSDVEEIKARDVASIAADDCVIFFWVTAPFLDAGMDILKAWGFDYVTCIIWNKEYPGEQHGLGYWFRVDHELVLVGKRGNVPCPAQGTQFPSVFSAPVTEHSAKPDNVHEIAEAYFPNLPKIELNARRRRPGWDAWGLEADGEEDCERDEQCRGAPDSPPQQGRPAADDGNLGAAEDTPPAGLVDVPAPLPADQLAAAQGAQPQPAAGARPHHDHRQLVGLTDDDLIQRLGLAVSVALGNGAALRAGDSRLHSAEERLIRRHVIRIAYDDFGVSFPRIAAVLGGSKQAGAQLRAAAAGEVEADAALAAKLDRIANGVAGRMRA